MDGLQTGMRILSLADPENPVELGSYLGDYVHDSWVRNDTLYASCISSATMRVFNFANPAAPAELVSWTYPGARTHSGEKSRDGRYLYACDEVNYGTMKVFDMQNIFAHPMIREITVNPLSIVHNVHVKRDTAFVAWYTEGVRLFDVTDPSLPAEWGYYDTYGSFSGGFHGVWEVAPFYPSGTFIASDIERPLHPRHTKLRDVGSRGMVHQPRSGGRRRAVGIRFHADAVVRNARLALSPGSHTCGSENGATRTHSVEESERGGLVDVVLQPAAVGRSRAPCGALTAGLPDATIEPREPASCDQRLPADSASPEHRRERTSWFATGLDTRRSRGLSRCRRAPR
jgi:hypothetical protein